MAGHKALECPQRDQNKSPDVLGRIEHTLKMSTLVDRDLWADFFNKCVKTHAAKKFRKFKKKQEEAAASTTPNAVVTPNTVVAPKTVTTRPMAVTTQTKKVNTPVTTMGTVP